MQHRWLQLVESKTLKMQKESTKDKDKLQNKSTKSLSYMTEENTSAKDKLQNKFDKKDNKIMMDRVKNEKR